MKTKKVKGIPCSNMREFDAIMRGEVKPEIQHTPTPWTKSKVDFDKDEWLKLHSQTQICIGKGMDITAIVWGPDDQEEANAAFIVRAVNSHDELLEAAKMAFMYFGENIRITPSQIAAKLSDAIAKAEGK